MKQRLTREAKKVYTFYNIKRREVGRKKTKENKTSDRCYQQTKIIIQNFHSMVEIRKKVYFVVIAVLLLFKFYLLNITVDKLIYQIFKESVKYLGSQSLITKTVLK